MPRQDGSGFGGPIQKSKRPAGILVVETDNQFRSTNATIAQVLYAFDLLIKATPPEATVALQNAKRVIALLGHHIS